MTTPPRAEVCPDCGRPKNPSREITDKSLCHSKASRQSTWCMKLTITRLRSTVATLEERNRVLEAEVLRLKEKPCAHETARRFATGDNE